MKRANLFKSANVIAGILLLVAAIFTHASNGLRQVQPQYEGPLPDALAYNAKTRRETIQAELAGQPGNEWAGSYVKQDDPTAGTQLIWAPNAGFVIKWSTCSHGWRERVNFGRAALSDGVLQLTPELSENSPNSYQIASTYTPVVWGKQHYLIPTNSLIHFCYAARDAKYSPEFRSFFVKEGDLSDVQKGLPQVPEAYRRFLIRRPLIGVITAVSQGPKARPTDFTLGIGSVDEVVSGMKFYALSPENVVMLIEVFEVHEHTSKAYLISGSYKDNREGELRIRPGWRVTSRAPKNASAFYPG